MNRGSFGTELNRQSILVLRILGLFTAVILPPFRYLLPADAVDPMWVRFALSGAAIVTVLLSFVIPNFLRYAQVLSYALAALLTTWMLILALQNSLIQEYTSSYFIMLFSSIILMRDRRWLLGFAIWNSCLVLGLVFWVEEAQFPPTTFAAMVVSIMGIGSMGQLSGLLEFQMSKNQGNRLRSLNDTALATSNEGILVTDHAGAVSEFNIGFWSLFDLQEENLKGMALESWLQGMQKTMVHPQIVMHWAKIVGQRSNDEILEQIELSNGRHVRLLSKAILNDQESQGRIWFFKDVTAAHLQKVAMEQQQSRLKRQNDLLMALSTDPSMQTGELSLTAPIIVTETAIALQADRASIWRMDHATQILHCVSEYNAKTGILTSNDPLAAVENPDYFKAIARERIVVINDAYQDPLTAKFYDTEPILRHSLKLLQVPLRLRGQFFGVLSIARESATQDWNVDDQQFLASIGDLLLMTLEEGERRKTERELAESAALLKAVFETAGIGILVTRSNRSVIDCNNTYLSIFKLSRDFLFREDPETVVAHCRAMMQVPEVSINAMQYLTENPDENLSERLYFKNGIIIERFTEVLKVDGQIIGRIWFYRDVTERARAEEQLRASEMQNKAIIDAMPDLILRVTAQGDILNLKMPDNWELSALIRDTKASHLRDLFPDLLAQEIQDQVASVLTEGKMMTQERALELIGTVRDYETRTVPSGPREVLLMLRDVTERKQTEKELRQRNHELDSFVYRASHDLKAPLNSLMGLLDILKAETQDPSQMKYMQLMDKSVLKLDTFVRNLTDFTRINRLTLQNQEVDFGSLLAEVIEGLRYMQNADRVTCTTQVELDAPFYGDAFHLSIALGNLISNAYKYCDLQKAEPSVQVSVRLAGGTCEIVVADNGVGIPKIHQGRIFELFFRATNQSFGSGLGLYITRNAIDKMGGKVVLDSEEGKGTTFTVTLPNNFQPA